MSRVLVVGCGITGAATAAALRKELPSHIDIQLWDKAEKPGGRMMTTSSPFENGSTVDLGAQYFTLTEDYVHKREKLYDQLVGDGVLKPLLGTIEGDKAVNARHYIAPTGSASIVQHFIQQAETESKFGYQLSSVDICPDTQKVKCSTQIGFTEEFDIVVLTMPVSQILKLSGSIQDIITSHGDMKEKLQNVTYSSRFCLGMFYKNQLDFPYSWAAKYFFDGPCIRFVSIDNKKRDQASVPESVVVHTSVPFSLQHLDEDAEDVQSIIVKHLQLLLPDLPEPDSVTPHKWRYSQVFKGFDGHPGCVVLNQHPLLLLAGDAFCHFPKFDGCLDSAEAVVKSIVQWCKPK